MKALFTASNFRAAALLAALSAAGLLAGRAWAAGCLFGCVESSDVRAVFADIYDPSVDVTFGWNTVDVDVELNANTNSGYFLVGEVLVGGCYGSASDSNVEFMEGAVGTFFCTSDPENSNNLEHCEELNWDPDSGSYTLYGCDYCS